MNGELFDYGIFDCPWMHSLDPDYPAMCLPYQEILSPIPAADLPTETVFNVPGGLVGDFAARDSTFIMPDGQAMECSDEIERLTGADADEAQKCSKADSALQWLKCGIPCPAAFPMSVEDFTGRAAVVLGFIVISMGAGLATYFKVGGSSENFFVAGRDLPVWILVCTLGSQCLDASSALGNLDLAYKYHFWDGAALPIGLALSLLIVGTFLAKPLHAMKLLTLPDAFARVYGEAAEVMCSLVTMISFIFLLAGNLVGCGKVTSYLFGMDEYVGIVLATFLIWMYSCAGGLLSVAYTDVIQALIGWTGFVVATAWIQGNMPSSAGVSVAYPVGDMPVIGAGLTDPDSYDPIPNAIFFNWATVIVLAFGNCMALDFNARCFAAKSGKTAQISCILAGIIAGIVGVFNTWNAGTMRALYGPSSPHAEFVANSCSADITVIGCFGGAAADPYLLGIVAASMSTADGAIVALGTVFSHNLLRKTKRVSDENLLKITRSSTLLFSIIAGLIASTRPNETGYFLIVAFDCVFAAGVVPLFALVYWKNIKPEAGFLSLVAGALCRIILEIALPKDGLLLWLGTFARSFGPGIEDPEMFDEAIMFGRLPEVCPQEKLLDLTGLDSLVSPAVAFVVLVLVQLLPIKNIGGKWFTPVPAPDEKASSNEQPENAEI
ncbi:SLC5A7 [Symbiodinium sp. CCMP2456]|nr:SLC5A7 [Symbiodinium sp. CCMP2456]